ncbi:hypothetical protein ACN4EG_26095 [Alkalinema pantanalense CENA528]|uniref:hypothetical protein n=1 Tax=Alkalinema pantanalense TaxID=1620705 RepID=UPI003D6F6F1C
MTLRFGSNDCCVYASRSWVGDDRLVNRGMACTQGIADYLLRTWCAKLCAKLTNDRVEPKD